MNKIMLVAMLGFALAGCGDDDNDNAKDAGWCGWDEGPTDDIRIDDERVAEVCYGPTSGSSAIRVEAVADGETLTFPQTRNNVVVVFDDDTNGRPVVGDLVIDGNKISIYGNGDDDTILDGDVTIDGNNVRIRGVSITGDLRILKNNAAVVDSVVRGNVTVEGNNTVIADLDVFGSVTASSNNNIFVDNDVQGGWSIGGNNNRCDENASFSDDGDFDVEDDEEGAALACG